MTAVLITGSSRGLGLEFVRQYAGDGWDVIATCRNPAKAEALKTLADQHKNIRIEALDVSDFKAITAFAAKLKDAAIDVLINNAGIFSGDAKPRSAKDGDPGQDFGSIDPESWARVLHDNTIAPIMMTQAFVPQLAKSKNPKVANITSRMGSISEMGSGYIAYRTSKAALNAAMVTISHDLTTRKIAVVNLHPGWVQTDMGSNAAPLKPEPSITGMRKVIEGLSLKNTGRYVAYDGKEIAW